MLNHDFEYVKCVDYIFALNVIFHQHCGLVKLVVNPPSAVNRHARMCLPFILRTSNPAKRRFITF